MARPDPQRDDRARCAPSSHSRSWAFSPSFIKSRLESYVTEATGRKATLGKVEINTFTLRATLTDFALADRAPDRTLVHFDMIDVDVSSATLCKRAPVLDAVRLVRPRVDLICGADGVYDIQDLIDWMLAHPQGPPPLFSINKIEIDDGAVSLDDRLHRRKVVVSKSRRRNSVPVEPAA